MSRRFHHADYSMACQALSEVDAGEADEAALPDTKPQEVSFYPKALSHLDSSFIIGLLGGRVCWLVRVFVLS